VIVLWPDSSDPTRARNDDSLVWRLEDGEDSFLLTADIEGAVERSILANSDELGKKFLKVPHHGGRTSSTAAFREPVHPVIAAISVGEANPYGDPNPETTERILAQGARLYRDGAVTITRDGQSMNAHSFRSSANPCSELSSLHCIPSKSAGLLVLVRNLICSCETSSAELSCCKLGQSL